MNKNRLFQVLAIGICLNCLPQLFGAETECCKGVKYDPATHECCKDFGYTKIGECCRTAATTVGYDPKRQCCTANGVRGKTILNTDQLEECVNKVARTGHVPTSNGCTGSPDNPIGDDCWIPDDMTEDEIDDEFIEMFRPELSFTPACNNHDICYDTCSNSKASCDTAFLNDILSLRGTGYPICDARITYYANIYYNFVNTVGGTFYNSAQQNACQCCPDV